MNQAKTLDLISQKTREILSLARRLHDAGYETTKLETGVGCSVVVTVGREVDVFAYAARVAYQNVTGIDNPFAEGIGPSMQTAMEAIIRDSFFESTS